MVYKTDRVLAIGVLSLSLVRVFDILSARCYVRVILKRLHSRFPLDRTSFECL